MPGDRLSVAGDRVDLQRRVPAGRGAADGLDCGAGEHCDAARLQLGVDQGAELRVDGGQHLGQLLDLGDRQAAHGQRVGHLQPDVARADDDRAVRRGLLKGAHDGERVVHRVQQVYPVRRPELVQPADRRTHRDRAGADDQLVVGNDVLGAVRPGDGQLAAFHVDPAGGGVQPQPHPGGLQVGGGAVGEVAPVGDLAGDVVRDAADGEVRVGVRGHHGDLRARVDLAGTQRGADPGVAAADGDDVHDYLPFSGCRLPASGVRSARRLSLLGAA